MLKRTQHATTIVQHCSNQLWTKAAIPQNWACISDVRSMHTMQYQKLIMLLQDAIHIVNHAYDKAYLRMGDRSAC